MSRKPAGGHRARKRFGQNFLHDTGVIDRIVGAIGPRPGDNLVEIGPGMGALSEPLLQACPGLQMIELDRDLIPGLRTQFFRYPELRIHESDALRFNYRSIADPGPLRVVGNLPYNIATPLIFHLLAYPDVIRDMHFMLQREVVERMVASPGNSQWGRLAIMIQYHCRVQSLFRIGPGAFRPAPKVDSAIVRLVPHEQPPHSARDTHTLASVVRTAFNARRKTLRKALLQYFNDHDWERLGMDSTLRPQDLTLADFVTLSNDLVDRQNNGRLE